MDDTKAIVATPQGIGRTTAGRLPLPERSAMGEARRTAADAIINGPARPSSAPSSPCCARLR